MFYTSTIYSYALSNCTNSYNFISYLCTVAVTHRMLLCVRVCVCMCLCVVYFSIQTLLVWFLAASIEVYCSALDTFYNQKVSLRCNPSFRFGHFQTTLVSFYMYLCMYVFTLFGVHHDVLRERMTTVNERRQGIGERVIVCLVCILQCMRYISTMMIKSDGVASI